MTLIRKALDDPHKALYNPIEAPYAMPINCGMLDGEGWSTHLRVKGLGFRDLGLGFRVEGFKFGVEGFGV